MSDVATEAARNRSIKERYPMKAINFACDHITSDDAAYFLRSWREGNWAEIEDCYSDYLAGLS